jgi:hypothetical protein
MNRILLSEDQIAKAKEALCDVAVRMKGLLPEKSEDSETKDEDVSSKSFSSSSNDEELDFEKYLDKIEGSKAKHCRLNVHEQSFDVKLMKCKQDFFGGVKEVEEYDRSSKLKILEVIPAYPEIVKPAAMIVTAMPSTQVSMFSALKIIRSDIRASMKEDLAEAVLFPRTSY